jgi:hypothetical protein
MLQNDTLLMTLEEITERVENDASIYKHFKIERNPSIPNEYVLTNKVNNSKSRVIIYGKNKNYISLVTPTISKSITDYNEFVTELCKYADRKIITMKDVLEIKEEPLKDLISRLEQYKQRHSRDFDVKIIDKSYYDNIQYVIYRSRYETDDEYNKRIELDKTKDDREHKKKQAVISRLERKLQQLKEEL